MQQALLVRTPIEGKESSPRTGAFGRDRGLMNNRSGTSGRFRILEHPRLDNYVWNISESVTSSSTSSTNMSSGAPANRPTENMEEPRSEMEQPVVEHPVMEHQAQQVQDIVAEEQEDDDEYIDVGSPPPMPEDYIPIHLALLEKDRLRKEEATVSFLNENPDYLQKNMELGAEGQPISAVESPGVNPASIGETSVIFPIAPTYSLPMWNYFSALSTGYVAFPTVGISSVFITSETSAFYNPGQVLGTDPLVADTVPDQEAPVDLSRQTGQNDPTFDPAPQLFPFYLPLPGYPGN
ncbi:hypothetical protein L3Y34_006456 [Caenorhabditis briggsae]|uniref:Uncharacterized protein n=1 Tax=Caenorhabditis briggsae TaxID=6238 RepID=A0AAE9CZK7_CAEBR|nr:hypothetical protein L3Y34_006456 [Caenorhabditis briggsae]